MEAGQITARNVAISCPHPLIAELSVPYRGGCKSQRFPNSNTVFDKGLSLIIPAARGRWCLETIGNVSCCLPCPIAEWTYSKGSPPLLRVFNSFLMADRVYTSDDAVVRSLDSGTCLLFRAYIRCSAGQRNPSALSDDHSVSWACFYGGKPLISRSLFPAYI